MPQTKLIYGVGRIPKASEFQLGEVIVNVDDSKVYSKSKSNVVFEIGTNNTGSSPTSTIAFSTASVFGSGIITAQEGSNTLIISGGSGITVATGSNNDLIISSQGDPDSDWFIDTVNGRLTSSLDIYVNGDITGSNALIGGLRIVGDKIQPSNTSLTSLEIDGNDARIQFNIGGAQYFKIDKEPGTSEFVLGNTTVSSSFSFFTKESTPALHVTSSGNVGIGTSTPEEKLTVAGNISASGYIKLKSNSNTTGIAGALLYSSSNEFYLGFS